MNNRMKNKFEDLALLVLNGLHGILIQECKHFNFYLQASVEVRGYERLFLKPLLEKEMASELEHMRAFGDKIVALGGSPTFNNTSCFKEVKFPTTGRGILEKAIQMEREILEIYHTLYPDAEKFAEAFDDMSVVLLLEENIEHTTADVEEMEKILGGLPSPTSVIN